MRASWVRPPPGSPISSYEEGKAWPKSLPKHGEEDGDEERKLVEIALSNFALVILEPERVDYVELGVQPNQRTVYILSEGGEWREQIVVP